jgi:CHAT domain-containing protein/tetratricopeptide (TPR) repeat protein
MTISKHHARPCPRSSLLAVCAMLLALSAPALAGNDSAALRAGVWERLLASLESLPARWNELPMPAVTHSGRLAEDVLEAATEAQAQAGLDLISHLAISSPETRAQLITQVRQQRALSEVDLWFPLFLAEREQVRDIDEAGLTVDAWLELAEQLGRRDVLFRAAGFALYLAQFRIPAARLAAAARQWSELPPGPDGAHGAASVNEVYGSILFRTGQHRKALDAYRAAKQLYRAVGDRQGQGKVWNGEATVLFQLGQTEGALSAYRQAHALFVVVRSKQGQGTALLGEADVLVRLGQHKPALNAYRRARIRFSSVNDKLGQGNTWRGEADLLVLLGENVEALTAYRRARAHFDAANYHFGQGNVWFGEARVLFRLGQNAGALAAYRQARSLFDAAGDKLGLGNTWIGEADVMLFRLGLHDRALVAYRQARVLLEAAGDELGQGNSWRGEADVLFFLKQNDKALAAYRGARARLEAAGDKLGQGNTRLGEADTLLRLGKHDDALLAYRQARALFESIGDELGQGNTWRGEADVLARLARLGPALHAAMIASRFARSMGSIPNELIARTREARILLASNQEAQAIQRAKEGLVLLRRWRQKGASDIDRTVMSNWSEAYDVLISVLARKHGAAIEEALALAEAARAPVLLDLLITGSLRPDVTGNRVLVEEREHLQRELAELDRKLQGTIEPGERRKLEQGREAVDAQIEIHNLVALGLRRSSSVSATPIDARVRSALVREVGPILLYYVAQHETVAFLLQPGQRTPLVRHIGLSRDQLLAEVRSMRHGFANPLWRKRIQDRQRALFQQLVAPFAEVLAETPRLTIIPHGPLHELPFEALLVDDTTPLFERWHVSIAPSLSALHAVRQRRAKRKSAPDDIAFVGIGGGTGLSLSGPAVEEVGAGFGAAARLISPGPGSQPAYLEHAPRARHLLVATHGTHVDRSRSGHLELNATEGYATRLTASEIAQTPLRAELVTLAACETARGEAMLSDERLDLTRAFLIAGADAVLATRWKVPATEETRLFLVDFYHALRKGGPGGTPLRKDEALTQARSRSRQRGDDAQLWAAWVLVGDGC